MLRSSLFSVNWLSAFQPQRHDPDLRAVPLGFLGLIVLGGLLLALPWSVAEGQSLGWLDAFFLSVSAVCVTGLSPVDVAVVLSGFGQAVLLLLIQLGGIGIVTASLALVMLGGKRLTLADEGAVAATIGKLQRAKPAELFRQSCLVVMLCEAAGATLIYTRLRTADPAGDVFAQLWQAVFHAVSAFCNAGFSILPAGLASWRDDVWLLSAVNLLVVAGGIGLLTLINLPSYQFWRRDPRRRGRITLQAKLALGVSLFLIVLGTLVTMLFEFDQTHAGQDGGTMLSWALTHSVMTRTAGFNVVDIASMHPATLLAGMALMFIGGSPGSMAGGVKTVTMAVLWCTARAALLRQEDVQIFGRRIAARTSALAVMVFLLGLAVALSGIAGLMLTELGQPASETKVHWLGLSFEAFSAFGTVGLSAGVTPLLTPAGKLIVMALMFIGRVGPLVLAVYLARPIRRWHVRHPVEDVALG